MDNELEASRHQVIYDVQIKCLGHADAADQGYSMMGASSYYGEAVLLLQTLGILVLHFTRLIWGT